MSVRVYVCVPLPYPRSVQTKVNLNGFQGLQERVSSPLHPDKLRGRAPGHNSRSEG